MSYKGFRIKEIHAIVGIGDDDEEGIPTIMSRDGPLPLISSDGVRLNQIVEIAQQVANATGKNFKVVRFKERQDIGEVVSERKQDE